MVKTSKRKDSERWDFLQSLIRKLPQWATLTVFALMTLIALFLPLTDKRFATSDYAPLFNALVSIGTGGLVSFTFYYVVNTSVDRHRRNLARNNVREVYRDAKRNIAYAVIHASQKGGRRDLVADSETVEKLLSTHGFKAMFEGGRQGDEGYYAFENQMSDATPEYDEIVFNLKVVSRAAERLIDNNVVDDSRLYDFFVRLGTMIARIERNGAGYDESKLLCGFIWEIFAGWNFVEGSLGYDPIERAIARL